MLPPGSRVTAREVFEICFEKKMEAAAPEKTQNKTSCQWPETQRNHVGRKQLRLVPDPFDFNTYRNNVSRLKTGLPVQLLNKIPTVGDLDPGALKVKGSNRTS